ncbi:globin family protein [Marinobacter mobilis]|uniref:Hemoglobin-like flavoprotein n=1 Tax=Marinobacter mobilis TaxID=488533 RepID=A0A1H3BNB1_9GAMM|nr:globin family protein [Marinobacter mobilis]SDX43337.1 Hemoglobin-like flavoprotein [Marinobacter mobilis]
MNEQQIALVQQSFAKVAPIADQAAAMFYQKLFELDPSLKPLFKGSMEEQGKKLMKMIGLAVNSLGRLDDLVPAVQSLGERHNNYGVKDGDYDTVGNALIWTLEQGLGDDFTPDCKDAWVKTYTLLAGTMKDAASAAA